MKYIVLFLLLTFSSLCFAQQTMPDSVYADTTSYLHTCHICKNCRCAQDTTKLVHVKFSELEGYRLCSYCEYMASSTTRSSSPTRTSSSSTSNSKSSSTYKNTNNHTIYTGPRGGKYYINSQGKKVYIKH